MTDQRIDPILLKEKEIFHLAGAGKKDDAKSALFQLIVDCAKKKDFHNAERLRDRLYEIDPMALTEIIRSGEIIELEKSSAVSEDHLIVWSRLLQTLTREQFTAIYHEMEVRNYTAEEIIVEQGQKNDELFFFNRGTAKVWHHKDDREMYIKDLHQGEIAGENFFNPSIWTVSISAKTNCQVSVLKHKDFERWNEKMPGLESKLLDFYNRFNDIHSQLHQKELDRRSYSRFELHPKILIQITDQTGKSVGKAFRGEMSDISRGGLSFVIRISRKENCRLLLGRHLRIQMPLELKEKLGVTGRVIAVQPYNLLESDYSVHMRFDSLLEKNKIDIITG